MNRYLKSFVIKQHCNAEYLSVSIFKEELTLLKGKYSNNKPLNSYTSVSLKGILQRWPALLSLVCTQEEEQKSICSTQPCRTHSQANQS